MEIPITEFKKTGIRVWLIVCLMALSLIGGLVLGYVVLQTLPKTDTITVTLKYKSDQHDYSFSYPAAWRLERANRAEGGYVLEQIDLYEGLRVRTSVKVIAKSNVQCPFFSLGQFVPCAFIKWQNVNSAPADLNGKKGLRYIMQNQFPPYDTQVSTYLEKGNNIIEVTDYIPSGALDPAYDAILRDLK